MNVMKGDLGRIRGSLLLLLVVGAVGAGAVYASWVFARGEREEPKAAERSAAEARKRVNFVQQEKVELRTLYPQYQGLIQRGVIGPGQRLEWVEAVESLAKSNNLFSINYKLESQRALEAPAAIPAQSGFEVRTNPMTLELTVLHEGQLVQFLDGLRREIEGVGIVDRCKVERVGTGRELRYGPQLKAACTLEWVTLREKAKS